MKTTEEVRKCRSANIVERGLKQRKRYLFTYPKCIGRKRRMVGGDVFG